MMFTLPLLRRCALLLAFACGVMVSPSWSQVLVNADDPESDNAFELFNEAFGGRAVESQNCPGTKPELGRRIREVFDEQLNKTVFEFISYVDHDIDCAGGKRDRARIEVKGYNKSKPELQGEAGERSAYRWKFKLEAGFQPTRKFTHLFQLKAFRGNDAGAPLITLTPRYKSSGNVMELIYRPTTASKNIRLTTVPLSLFEDRWVDAYIQVDHVDDQGSLSVVINDVHTGEQLLAYADDEIDMYRDAALFNRPKWGIYRSLAYRDQLRDERVRFADFCVAEGEQVCF